MAPLIPLKGRLICFRDEDDDDDDGCCACCSRSLSLYMRQFVCSVVVGKDLVPRLGIVTLDGLKRQMLNQISSCRLPKVAKLLHLSFIFRIIVCIFVVCFVHVLYCVDVFMQPVILSIS